MTPIEFKGHNTVFAKDQPEYNPLPAHKASDKAGTVTTCWKFGWLERMQILFGGNLYISVMTFNQPLQPILPSTEWETPDEREEKARQMLSELISNYKEEIKIDDDGKVS